MASYQAIIDLIVNGQTEVDRVIRSTDQLATAIGRINSRPLELQPGRAQQSVERLTRGLQGIDRQVEQAAAHLAPLRNNFQAVSREAGTLDRALQRNSRSLEVNRRQSQIYENTIRNAARGTVEFVNATAAGARAVVRNIGLTEQRTQLERRRAAVDARMTYQLRQMAGAEADLAEAQERRGQAFQDRESARGLQAQIQFADRLARSYMNAEAAQQRAARGLRDAGLDDLAGRIGAVQSTAGLRSEIQFFDSLASSVATNTEAFKRFTIASRAASQSLAEVNRNRLAILAEAFTPPDRPVMGPGGTLVEPPIAGRPLEPGQRPRTSNEARRGTSGRALSNEEVSRTRQEVDRLINSFNEVPRSEAGLRDYIERLGELRSVVTFTSEAYRRLAQQQRVAGDLLETAVSLQRSGAMQGPAQFAAATGPASLIEAPENRLKRQLFYEKTREDILSRLVTFENNINEADLTQVQRTQLQIRLDEALLALDQNRLDVARRLTREGEQARMSTERENRRNRITGGPMRAGGPGETIASIDAPQKVQEILRQTTTLQLYLNKLASEGVDVTLQQSAAQNLINELSAQGLQLSDRFVKAKRDELSAIREITKQEKIRQTGGLDPEVLEGRVQRLLGRTIGLESKAISLQEKGATNADQLRLEVQQKINALKQLEGSITSQNADAVANDLRILLKSINEISNAIGEARNQISQVAKLTGFEGSFQKLQTSFGETGSFFQNVSPEEAVDKIVRQFTPSLAGTTGLATLEQLEKPAKLSSQKLTLLASTLQEVAAQIDPLAPGARRLLKEVDDLSASLQNEQAGRAPDADFLVRLTKNPRLAAGISEGLIGGAFPLLFGQGVGAAAGGGIGGFAGGYAGGALGFGLSLIGTAVGSAVDTTVNNLKELASSLKEPTAALEAMKTAGLKVDSGLQDLVGRLETVGNAAAAQAIVFAELEKQLGPGAAKQLNALSEEQKKLDEINQKLYAALSSEMLPLLTGTISIINDFAAALQRIASIDVPDWVKNVGGAAFNVASVINPGFGLSRAQFENARKRGQEAAERAGTPPLTQEGQRKQELLPFQQTTAALSAGLEASDIAKKYTDAIKTAAEEQKDLDNQRFELIESYEKSIADIRRGVEQRITQERLAVIAKENELFAAQGEVRLQQLRNANAELRATVFGNEIGQQLIDAVSEFTEKQLSTENEVANRRRSLELELESKRIEIEQYRIDVAKQVSDLNLSTQKQVEKINDGILKKNQAYDRSRFEIEKRININNLEIKRLEAKQQENLFRGAANNANPAIAKQNRELADLYANQATFIEAQKNAVKSFAPPPELSFGSVSAGASVSTAGLDALSARARQLATAIASIQDELSSLASSGDFIGFNARLKEIADQGATGLVNQFEQLKGQLSNNPLGAQFAKIKEGFEAVAKTPEIAPYKELVFEYQKLAEANVKLGASLEFFLGKGGQQSSQLDSLRVEINSAITGTTELEKAMMDLAQRGISPASEEFKILTDNAARIDALQQKLQIINSFKTASSELTLSLRGLVEGFYELGGASEAVRRVGEELGRKSLGFVLDIAFKPVEQAMQKTMFDLAERFGFDIKPEQLQQLEEIKATRLLVAGILEKVTSLSGALPSVIAPVNTSAAGMVESGRISIVPDVADVSRFLIGIQGASLSASLAGRNQDLFKSQAETFEEFNKRINDWVSGLAIGGVIRPGEEKDLINAIDQYRKAIQGFSAQTSLPLGANQIVPGPASLAVPGWAGGGSRYQGGPASQQIDLVVPSERRYRVGDRIGPQSSLPGAFTGIGGPDLVFPLDSNTPRPIPLEVRPEATQQIEQLDNSLQKLGQTAVEGSQNIGISAESLNLLNKYSTDFLDSTTGSLQQNVPKLQAATTDWGKSLGQVVTGLGLASSAVIGIVGGVQNIQKGGAGNVLSGIGSILTTVGSIGMSAVGFMGPKPPISPTAAGGDVWGAVGRAIGSANGNVFEGGELMKFANGGIVQSPTLFSFEDAGVTRTGQAGEAGAEAIMPLKRTKDGRLGVEADLSVPFEASDALEMGLNDGDDTPKPVDLSVPFQKAQGRMSAAQMMQIAAESGLAIPFAKDQGAALGGGAADGGDDTIKFESVIINNQEFVTRKEAEEIGRKAEARGASRGAQLAQKGIKNNPRIRASLGMK
jgi:hypothetical protein